MLRYLLTVFMRKFLTTKKLGVSTFTRDHRGTMLMLILVFGALATTVIISGVASYAIFENRASNRVHRRDVAFHIAEAGINYYRWHLAHNPTDYTDGTGQPGPYQRVYQDKDGNTIGYFSLQITPPLPGSTVAIIRSTGWTIWDTNVRRTIQVRVGFPSLADYTFLSNANMAFSFTTTVSGTVHSNGGIRFDGLTDSWVRSARDRYEYLPNQWRNGIWGGGGPKSFWQFPVPAIDFQSVTADLGNIRTMADNGGIHLTSSGQHGWHMRFTSSTFNLYRVTALDCANGEGRWRYRRFVGWYWEGNVYCYDIRTETFVQQYTIPANGAIFVEDDVWIDGTVDGRVTVGVGRFPVQQPYKKALIPGNLTYAARGSDDVVGIIAQGDIVVPFNVPNDMEINAAALSQFGTIHRPYYWDSTKNSLVFFGSQISYEGGGWKYVNGFGNVISGFINTYHVFDGNLRYLPPPGFPVANTYDLISWEEIE